MTELAGVSRVWTEDQVEQGLLEVQALIDDAVVRHRDFLSREATTSVIQPDEDRLADEVARLISQTGQGVEAVLASNGRRAEAVYQALDALLTARGDTVAVRLLCVEATLDREFVRRHLRAGRRLEVRTTRLPSMETVLIDHRIALSCADLAAGRCQAAVIRDRSVIRTMHNLFAGVWRRAVPFGGQLGFGGRARTEFAIRILGWLNAGVTDEVAARELSVSVRTYRRHVAEILGQLGASSRFQAGARAAELGLLPADPARRLREDHRRTA